MKKTRMLILLLFGILILGVTVPTEAAMNILHPKKVLLVYDSLRQGTDKSQEVHSIERLLSSFQYQVTSKGMDEYKQGEIKKEKYDAVITMINWPQMPLENKTFYKERDAFKGKKLHIGGNLTQNEMKNFSNQWDFLEQQNYKIIDNHGMYDEVIGLEKYVVAPINISKKEKIVSYMQANMSPNHKKNYPYGLIEGKNAYLPFYHREGATFLSASELFAKWLGIHQQYDPYVAILDFTPLSNMEIAKQFVNKMEKLENEIIIGATSSAANTDLNTFKVYLSLLRQFSLNKQSVVYLNTPALNNVGDTNNQLMSIMQQEVSTFIENSIFPLGISAPAYWNFDSFYQNSALSFAQATLLYEFDKTPVYHTKTNTSLVYPVMFYDIKASQLENINWHINGKYTDFRFPMPVTISYPFPNDKEQLNKMYHNILNDPFPPTSSYLYTFKTGVSTQTQSIIGMDGRITLNGEPIVNLNLGQLKERREKFEKNAKKMQQQASVTVEKNAMNRLNDILVIVIVVTLIILIIMLFIGRKLYRRMFISEDKKIKKKGRRG